MRPMRLLVTGGAGFIGSNFIRYWLGRHPGDSVTNLDALTYAGDRHNLDDLENAQAGTYAFVHGDIGDFDTVLALMKAVHPDAVVNFAAESHNSRAVLDPAIFTRTNVLGTQTLLESARIALVPRFHHVSTCEVYGDLPLDSLDSFDETAPLRPRTPYNASKAAADLLVRAYHLTLGLPMTISVSSNNYGPYQHPEKVIPLFATNALEGQTLPLYRQSANRREWLHVDDHCHALELILLHGRIGETYNVGSGEERSIDEVADAILNAVGKSASLKRYVDDRPGHDRRYLLNHTKISRELGWQPRVRFDDGLLQTVRWYEEHRNWWAPKKKQGPTPIDEFAWRR
jgi:dTDP-glucose 4,6-dehydratase